MTNEVKQKSLKCIEWILHASSSYNTTTNSETVSFQDLQCNLRFHSGVFGGHAHLYFIDYGDLQLPVTVTVRVILNSEVIYHQKKIITYADQEIWVYPAAELVDRLLTFEIVFHADFFTTDEKAIQTPSYIDTRLLLESVSNDFAKLLDDGPNHDVKFTFGDQSITAHKNILCSRSDYFAKMLHSDMVEGKTGRVNIQDMDVAIFQQFLEYLYTGILPELTVDTVVQFYKAGDKYAIDTLKKQCAEFLTDNLSLENAYNILLLADRHSDPDLKKRVMKYVFKEKVPIQAENWTDFCTENPILANEILNSFCKYLCPK